ncbi:hypothetical protein RISK_002411 [Rhodopirellula islandica]|uniref:Uncharacterized protein n=1 Tax=Rhodopirellula islandica TaxID=595434 RepID=A0A0J1EJU0_RHOIS|nr:hypothetical protein RISK_002411 [Rhodopirellula islandica]
MQRSAEQVKRKLSNFGANRKHDEESNEEFVSVSPRRRLRVAVSQSLYAVWLNLLKSVYVLTRQEYPFLLNVTNSS